MNIFQELLLQAKKPAGIIGYLMAELMNIGHNKLTNWGLKYLTIDENDEILDIGCGGGRTINKMAKMIKNGKVYGIDYSDVSVKLSSKLNNSFINQGKVQIQKASVSSIPFPDDFFDIITAIETHFLWTDLENDMKEVFRVLKPKGNLLIVSETYKNSKNKNIVENWSKAAKIDINELMHFQTREELEYMLQNAGFKENKIYENQKKGWISGIGTKI